MSKGKQKNFAKADPTPKIEPAVRVPDAPQTKVQILGPVVIGNEVKVKGEWVEIETIEKYGIDVGQLKARGLAK